MGRKPKEIIALRNRVNKLVGKLKPLTEHQITYFMLSTSAKSYKDAPKGKKYVWAGGMGCSYTTVEYTLRNDYTYATVIDACEEFNVVRTFQFCHTYYKYKPNIHSMQGEVRQIWIAPDGKSVIRERALAMYHYQRLQPFSFWNDMRIKDYKNYNIWDNHLLVRSITPLLRQRGFRTTTYGMDPTYIITDLLTSNKFETLWKTKQIDAVKFYNSKSMTTEQSDVFFAALKIAFRHKYLIADFGLWYDMVTSLSALGKDIHSPYYVCPTDLKQMHDKAVKGLERVKENEKIKKLVGEALLHEADYGKRIDKYRDICLENDSVKVFVCPTVKDMAEEGERMHHCVYRCGYYKAEHKCLILFVRDKQTGERISTVELGTSNWNIRQNRGKMNQRPENYDEVNKLINDNIGLFKSASKKRKPRAKVIPIKQQNEQLAMAA